MSGPHECPTCDYTTDTKAGVNIHHANSHGESIAKTTIECATCGKSVEKYKSNMHDSDNYYCSNTCRDKHQATLPPEKQPAWNGGKATVSCETCGKEKQVKRYRLDTTENFFCSDKCYNKWRSETFSGKNHPDYNRVRITCDNCGESFEKTPSRYDRSEYDFCSPECHNKWMSEHQHGPNHHQWKGGRRDYGPGWNEHKRESVRERDGRECIDCGLTEGQSIAEFGRKLDVHHLISPDSDYKPEIYNAKHNLVTLCIRCHHKWEAQALSIRHPVTSEEVTKFDW